METPEGTIARASKRRCLRRDKESTVCTPQKETSPRSFFPDSFLSPAVANTASHRPFSTARTSSSSADCGRVVERSVATPKTTTSPYKSAFPSAPRHATEGADMAKQQFTIVQSLQDGSQGSQTLVNALQDATDLALQTGDRQAELVALAQNALKAMKNVNSGRNEKASAEGTDSLFPQASPTLHPDHLLELLRQRQAVSGGCESRQGSTLYPENEEKPQEPAFRKGQIIEDVDFLRLRGDTIQQRCWTSTAPGLSHYDTSPKGRHFDDTKNPTQAEETNSQLPNNPRDVLHFHPAFQNTRGCRSASPERGSLLSHRVAGGNENSASSTPFPSAVGAPHHRAEPSLASSSPLLCFSPETLPATLRVDASSRPPPSASSPDVILQALRTLISLTAPSRSSVVPCNFSVPTGSSERDLSAASVETLSALLRPSNVPATTTMTSSAAGLCASLLPDTTCEAQRAEASSSGGVHPAAQNLLYTLLMSCVTGHQRQAYAEREDAVTGTSSARTAGRETRQCSALANQQGGHPSHSRMLSTAQGLMCTPPHAQSSSSRVDLGDFGSLTSSSADYRPGSCVAGQGFGKTQQDDCSKDMNAVGSLGLNCSISGLLAKKTHSMDICRTAFEDAAQITPTHSSYSSLRRRASLLIAADKEASPGGPRCATGEGTGISRGRSRTENLTRGDNISKADSQTRSESTNRTGTAGRGRGRYAGVAAGAEVLTPGSVGRGVCATAAGAAGCSQENQTGKPDVTLGGNRPHYHVAKQEWRVRYYLNGKRKMRTYSAKFYGYEAAHSMATDFAQYVDKNEALPHPVCKPVGLSGGRGAAALSSVLASRALSAAAAARERSEGPDAPLATRHATTRHDHPAGHQPRPLFPWESSPAEAAKSLEALHLACSAGVKAGNCSPQQTQAAAARVNIGGCDTFSLDGEVSPTVMRLGRLSRSSTPLLQASATPSDEEQSPYYEHSQSSNTELDRESSSRIHEVREETAPQQKYCSVQEQQTTTPSPLTAGDIPSEVTLANFLKSRKRRNPSMCCLGGPTTRNLPDAAVARPTVAELEGKTNGTPGEVRLSRASRTPSGAAEMMQGPTEKPEEEKLAAFSENAAGKAGAEIFLEGLQDNEKVYLTKLFSSVWTPVGFQHPADVAPVRDRGGSTCSLGRSSGSVASAAPSREEIRATAVASQPRCALLLHRQDTRCRPLQTNSPSISSLPENSSTSSLSINRSDSYKTLTEAGAASHKASACSLATELQERHAARSPPPTAGLSGELTAEETGVWVKENYSRGSRDTRGIPPGWTDFTGGGGTDGAEAGAAAGTATAAAAEATAPAPLGRTQAPMSLTSLVETDSERNAGLAPGHATAAMLAKTAMSQQMLDTVMLFDEFIRGFEKVFSAEQLQQQRRAILAPATCFAAEVSACLPSLTSPALAAGGTEKTNRNCDATSALSFSSSPTTAGDIGVVHSRSPSDSSVLRNAKDSAWFCREGSPGSDVSKQAESFVHTGTSLSASLALSQAAAGAPVPHEGVSRVVTGVRLHLRSSELLVLSRVLVELTSSTYVLVTTLRATLASSTKIVQKYCETLPPDGVQAKQKQGDELSKDVLLEPGEAGNSIVRSNDHKEWDESQQKGAERVLAAAGAHAAEVGSKQPHEEEKRQQQEAVTHAEMPAKRVLVCFAAASGGGPTSNLGSSWDRNRRDQAADVKKVLHTEAIHTETKAERDTTVTEVLRPRINTEAGPAADVALLEVAAEEATTGEGENTGGQGLQSGLVAGTQREELRPDEGASFPSKPGEQPVASTQTPLQAAREMEGAEPSCSYSVADSSLGGSPRKQSKERSAARECSSAGLAAEQVIENRCHKNPKVAQGDCHTAETPLKLSSCNLQQNATSDMLKTHGEEGDERAGQQTKPEVARDPAKTPAAASKQQHVAPKVAAEEGAAGARESSTAEQVAQKRELRQKAIRCHRLQQQGENDLRMEQRLGLQQHLPQFGATSLSASFARKEVVSHTCADSAAVLQGIVTLLQSQQRLVSVVRQLQASLPQYLRLIIRVAGHYFLPYKLPPATYFVKTRGSTARDNAPDAPAAAAPAATVRSAQALGTALARETVTKVREHEHAQQPPAKGHRGSSSNEEEVLGMHSSGSIATAGENASRSVSLEAEEEQTPKQEKAVGELQQQDKAKPCAELPERLSSFMYLSRQSSVAGFPACGALTSASSTEVEYSCSESPGLPSADTERKLSRDTAEDEIVVSSAYKEGPSCGSARTELRGKKQWECAEGGFAVLAKAATAAHYTLDEEDERTATSVATGPPLAGRASPLPYVEVPGGRVIQDEAGLEVFLLRPFQSSACSCQERPCPCDRQHIADLIHMLYTLPRPCEEIEASGLCSLPAASGDTYAPPHSADAGAAVPSIFAAPRGGTTAALSRSIEAASSHASARQQEWQTRMTQDATRAAEALRLQEVSGSGPDLSDAAAEQQQRMSLLEAAAEELPATREVQHTRNSSSSSVRFKPHGGIASSRTTSSGSSSSSSEPSVIGSDALMLVEESLRQVLFAEKLKESSNGSASSTHALPSASASPFCGSQTTNTPHTLLSAADTPGSASSCASSPFQRGLSAAAAAASSLLREAARQSIALAIGEEKRVAAVRDGKATPGAATTTVKEEEDTTSGAGRKKRRPTGFSPASSPAVEHPATAILVASSASSAPIRKTVGCSAANGDALASSSVSLPVRKGCLQASATGTSEETSPAVAVCSASGAEKLKETATAVGSGDSSTSTPTDGARDVWRGRSSPESVESRDCLEDEHVGTGSAKAGRAADENAAALLNQKATQQARRAAERVDGDEEQVKTHTFEKALLGKRASGDAASAGGGKRAALGSSPATGAEGASAAGVTLAAEDSEGRAYSAPASKSLGSGEGESNAAATEPTSAGAGTPYENVAADASGKTGTGLAPVAAAALVAETQGDAESSNKHAARGGKLEGEDDFSAAISGRIEKPYRCHLAAAVAARAATCSADASGISYIVGGSGKLQQSSEAGREAIGVLHNARETRQQTAENQTQNAFEREGLNGRMKCGVGASDEADQSRVSAGRTASEEERDSRTPREEAEAEPESRRTRCSLLQERQSLTQQERGAALLNRSYPTVLASILPLQSLAHTIARLILHLHRQLVCRFIAAHARMLLNTQKGHGKASLTPALLQHLIRQLVETDSGCSNSSNSSSSRSEGSSSTVSGTRCPSNRCHDSSSEESQSSSSSSRGVAHASHGPAVAADKCASASRPNALWEKEPVPDASVAATEAFAKTAAGPDRLGEEPSEGLRKRSAIAVVGHSAAAASGSVQRVVEQRRQESASMCDTPGSSRGGRGAGGCPAEVGCVASPAMCYASLLHTRVGDDVPSNVSDSGMHHSFYTPESVAPAAPRMARADHLITAKNEREERRGPGSCVTYADIVRAAAAAVSAPAEATVGQQADLSLSRECGGAPAAVAAAAAQKFAVPVAACVSTEKKAAAPLLPACPGDAVKKEGSVQLSSADILDRVLALSRPPTAAGAACGFPSVEDTTEEVFDCQAAELSQFLVRAHAFYASRGAGEKSAPAARPAFNAEKAEGDGVADSREDGRASLLAFPSSGEASSSGTRSCLY